MNVLVYYVVALSTRYLLGGLGSFGDLKNTFQVDKSGVPCTMGKKGSVKVVEFVPALSAAANGELITQA